MTDRNRPAGQLAADTTFAVVPTWVLDAAVSATAVRLYAALRRYADAGLEAWPSRGTLAARMGCSRDTVDRALRQLVGIGALTIERRWTPTGEPTTSLYHLHSQPVGRPVDNLGGVAANLRLGGRTSAIGVAAPVRHRTKDNERENPPTPPQAGGACPVHGDTPVPNRRCCGTTARQLGTPPLSSGSARPAWCGTCDEGTRMLEASDGTPSRCPACHPLEVAPWDR